MKKLVNLKGAKALNRNQQKDIFGGNFTTPGDEGGGGWDDWYCGCNHGGDNQPARPSYVCSSNSCGIACIGYGGWNGVCITVG